MLRNNRKPFHLMREDNGTGRVIHMEVYLSESGKRVGGTPASIFQRYVELQHVQSGAKQSGLRNSQFEEKGPGKRSTFCCALATAAKYLYSLCNRSGLFATSRKVCDVT